MKLLEKEFERPKSMWFVTNNIVSHSILMFLSMKAGADTAQYGLEVIFNSMREASRNHALLELHGENTNYVKFRSF